MTDIRDIETSGLLNTDSQMKRVPTELSLEILKYLHALDIRHLANAAIVDRSLFQNVALPCLEVLRPVRDITQHRRRLETAFKSSQDTKSSESQRICCCGRKVTASPSACQVSMSCCVVPEYRIAFLDWNESLHWLPPVSDEVLAWCEDEPRADALAFADAMLLCEAAKRLDLTIPPSFLTFMSDVKLQLRLPHSFWMPDRTNIPKASELITNGQDGYVLDFCYQYRRGADARMWSLWLGPQGSHCVVQRDVLARASALQEAQLVGASFETWLACTFFTHWEECSVNICSDAHWHLDRRLLASLNSYTQYNYDT